MSALHVTMTSRLHKLILLQKNKTALCKYAEMSVMSVCVTVIRAALSKLAAKSDSGASAESWLLPY